MKPRTIRHFLKEALRSMFINNRLMSFASILTVASCIFIVSVFYVLAANMDHMLRQMEDTLSIIVHIDEDLPAAQLQPLADRIIAIPQVNDWEFVDRDGAFQDFTATIRDGDIIFDRFEHNNPLRHAFVVELTDIRYHTEVREALERLEPYGVAQVGDAEEWADILVNIRDIVQIVSILLILVLAAISIVLIINTIRIAVSSRQTEIGIMKFVGATDWFIRWPFVIEGLTIGLVGGAIPAIVSILFYDRVVGAIANVEWLGFIDLMPGGDIFIYLIPFALVLGTLIGLIGSLFSVTKYLKV